MPELFGVARAESLSPDDRAGIRKLRAQLSPARPAIDPDVAEPCHSWYDMGALRLHANDPADGMGNVQYQAAWIGNGAPANAPSWSERINTIGSTPALLTDIPPPFAGCVIHHPTRTLHLVSDPLGLLPIYCALRNGLLFFASKLTPLLRSGLIRWSLDPAAVHDFFTYEHVLGDRTFAREIKVLAPGTVLSFHNGRVTQRAYADLPHPDDESIPRNELAERLFDELKNATAQCMPAGARIAVTLSGGLDSRAILGCAVKSGPADLRAYTFGASSCNDVRYARRLAETCGIPHELVPIGPHYLERWLDHGVFVTGGMVSCIHYHILALADALAADADVVLDGLAGDALTGAHLSHRMLGARRSADAAQALQRQRTLAWPACDDTESPFTADFNAMLGAKSNETLHAHFAKLRRSPPWLGCHRFDLRERQRRFIQYGPHQLRPFVNVQTPFCAWPIVTLLTAAPGEHLIGQNAYIEMHRRYLPNLARVPDATRALPVSCPRALRSAKRVFDASLRRLPLNGQRQDSPTDYDGWFRGALRTFVAERLLDRRAPLHNFVYRDRIESLLNEHNDRRAAHARRIGCLVTFDAWLRTAQNPATVDASTSTQRMTHEHCDAAAR